MPITIHIARMDANWLNDNDPMRYDEMIGAFRNDPEFEIPADEPAEMIKWQNPESDEYYYFHVDRSSITLRYPIDGSKRLWEKIYEVASRLRANVIGPDEEVMFKGRIDPPQ